jgi:2-haloacid dehalogenase
MLDLLKFRALTFDCYGTLIDWETGIFGALRPILAAHNKPLTDAALLEIYGELELEAETGNYQRYRDVLKQVVRGFGTRLGFSPSESEVSSLPDSLPKWKPFADTVESLRRLKKRYQLAILSNIDDDLFAASAKLLQVPFDHVITAQQAGSYKPSPRNFEMALSRIGLPKEEVLHCGQSIFHDVIPARALGLATVWVNRASPRPGAGATRQAQGEPDLEVPDLQTLASLALV